jgi:hypothetical protein
VTQPVNVRLVASHERSQKVHSSSSTRWAADEADPLCHVGSDVGAPQALLAIS